MKNQYPRIPDIRYALIETYAIQNKIDLAISETKEWLIINPEDERAKQTLEYLKERL